MDPVPGVPPVDGLSFAFLATTAGATVAAGIIFGVVQVLKGAFPVLVERLTGAGTAFVLSAILYILVCLALWPSTMDGYLVIFLSWLNCALVAVGIHSTATTTAVRAGVAALRDPGVAEKAMAAIPPTAYEPEPDVVVIREDVPEFPADPDALPEPEPEATPIQPIPRASRKRDPDNY